MVREIKALLIVVLLVVSACAKPVNNATKGAVLGGAVGAGMGAVIGNQTGNAGAGTAIGAGFGALSGALVGNALDDAEVQNEARRADLQRNDDLIRENQRLIEELRRRGADVRDSKRGVVINLPDVLFQFNSYKLTREAGRTIGEIADVLKEVHGRDIAVEGHTDSVGSVTYNKRLSVDRATTVADELVYHGIPQEQIIVKGFGEGAPIATNNSPEGRARNRRVEVIIEN